MKHKRLEKLVLLIIEFIFLCSLSGNASAELVDDILINTEVNGEVNAVIKFAFPIQYLRHFPQGKAPLTSIYFNILSGVPASEWQDYESHRTPPSDLVQDITVTTRDRGTGPKVLIKFYRPAEFTVTMGSSNQVLVVHIKPEAQQKRNESKPAPGTAGVAAAIAAVPAVAAVLPSVAVPSVSVPIVSSSTTKAVAAKTSPQAALETPMSVKATPTTVVPAPAAQVPATPVPAAPITAAPVPTPPVVAASSVAAAAPVATVPVPSAPVAPSGDITAPKVVLPVSTLKPIHLPLGSKDGLPDFPEIDQGGPKSVASATEKLSLAEQIAITNQQAAQLMEKGGRALLAGQSMVAVESFNNALNLPPNKYSQDAQLWIGIARERSGQLAKSILEFNSYLKIYPDGKSADWVKIRLGRLKASQPDFFNTKPTVQAKVQNTEMQYSEYGSLSMYYYQGKSRINTTALAGTVQTSNSSSFSKTDQKTLMSNVTMTARAYNNEYDNRLVFQGFGAANLLPGQNSTRRLGAAFYEMKDRIVNYSAKVGVQSGFGGGVMGRFFGVSAGYGFTQDTRANIVTGQLIDFSSDAKPVFVSGSFDFGTRSPLGGSVYVTTQRVNGLTDRRAVGGNLRYFEQGFNILSVLDYDTQFRAVNIFTVQGTLLGRGASGTDFNFLLDRRRSPILDIRNAVNGAGKSIQDLLASGYSTSQMLDLAKERTSVTNLGQIGMTNHLNEKWLVGTDLTLSNTSGLPRSGGTDPTVSCADSSQSIATEGCLDATPASGLAWTISERLTGMGIFQPGDVSNLGLSYTKSPQAITEAFQASNHSSLNEKWTVDTSMSMSHQVGSGGYNANNVSPMVRAGYKVRNNLTADAQLGIDVTKYSTTVANPTSGNVDTTSSTATRGYFGCGFNLSF